jgi:hypothetical protein
VLRAVPFDEFSDRMIIGSLGTWRGQAVQNSRLRLLGPGASEQTWGTRLRFTLLFAIDAVSVGRGKQHVSGTHFGHRTLARFPALIYPNRFKFIDFHVDELTNCLRKRWRTDLSGSAEAK